MLLNRYSEKEVRLKRIILLLSMHTGKGTDMDMRLLLSHNPLNGSCTYETCIALLNEVMKL